jgi:hypothetical protein
VTHVKRVGLSACFAAPGDIFVLALAAKDKIRLRILARGAEDKLVDKGVKQLLKSFRGVRTVDNVLVVGERSLSAKFASKEFSRVFSSAFEHELRMQTHK